MGTESNRTERRTDPVNQDTVRSGDGEPEVYEYHYSGIKERHGKVPLWLKLVAFLLIIWGGYYLVRFWELP